MTTDQSQKKTKGNIKKREIYGTEHHAHSVGFAFSHSFKYERNFLREIPILVDLEISALDLDEPALSPIVRSQS